MNNITFDKIHTQTKQKKLMDMMHLSALACHQIYNTNNPASACPICQSTEFSFYVEKFGFRLDKCHKCQQIFCNPMPNREQLNCYYNGEMGEFENQFFEDSFENRIPIFDYRIKIIQQYLDAGNLLDIGSAIGIFIEALNRANTKLNISCCEPSEDACERLRKRFPKVTLFNDWMQNLPNTAQYDGISLWDTLEHIDQIDTFCTKLFNLLKPGGYWFFSTPNTSSFEWEIAGKDHVQLLPPGHINLFNPNSIKILLNKHDFELIEILTPNGSLDVSYIEKLLAKSTKYDVNIGAFLKEKFKDAEFKDGFIQLISQTKNAGNMLVVARKPK
ncbi:class I SAM-dependent methyltransferase [Aliiglaciecola sp. SL4]|uniref:class I SAM-dependent methyltransferase n=1 Tax=Aliiglaciecola sp. SL4 TaxID=3239806 RepID=UPI00355C0435